MMSVGKLEGFNRAGAVSVGVSVVRESTKRGCHDMYVSAQVAEGTPRSPSMAG